MTQASSPKTVKCFSNASRAPVSVPENIALIAAYMDYLMNLEENNSGLAADNRPISKWKEFGLHKGVLRI